MGNEKSKPGAPAFLSLFTDAEQEKVQEFYSKMCGNTRVISSAAMENHLKSCLPRAFCNAIYLQMAATSHSKAIDFDVFVTVLALLFKSRHEERAALIIQMSSKPISTERLNAQELFLFALNLLEVFHKSLSHTPEAQSWHGILETHSSEKFAHFLLRNLFSPELKAKPAVFVDETPSKVFIVSEVEDWLMKTPIVFALMDSVFQSCFPVLEKPPYTLPSFKVATSAKRQYTTILDLDSFVAINAHLPKELTSEWRQLFNSSTDGQSFSRLSERSLKQGPTVVIIRDEDHNVFGGFASTEWTHNSKFQGTDASFVFQLTPVMEFYLSTGYNPHYFYLNENQQTFPNGLGFGGQIEYFGIFLSTEFGIGSCAPSCMTYNSPQLSKNKDFKVDTVEVWGVGPVKEKSPPSTRRSVLDKDKEAVALLEMSGRTFHSDGIREEDENE